MKTDYYKFGVSLTDGQKEKLAKAFEKKCQITLRLSTSQLSGNDELMLTKTQIGRAEKSKRDGTGTEESNGWKPS